MMSFGARRVLAAIEGGESAGVGGRRLLAQAGGTAEIGAIERSLVRGVVSGALAIGEGDFIARGAHRLWRLGGTARRQRREDEESQ